MKESAEEKITVIASVEEEIRDDPDTAGRWIPVAFRLALLESDLEK